MIRDALMTFSGVASNFAGVPLALAFIFTLGQLGILTLWLKGLGIDPYASGFTIYSKIGLELVYLYFQFPLMVLIIAPAIDGLRPEWREAAENMGASSRQYWQRVALPILMPTLLGTHDPALRQRLRGAGDRLSADRRPDPPRAAPDRQPDLGRRAPQPGPRAMPWPWAWSSSWLARSSCTPRSSGERSGGGDEATSRRHRLVAASLLLGVFVLHLAALRHARLLAQGAAGLRRRTRTRCRTRNSSRASATRRRRCRDHRGQPCAHRADRLLGPVEGPAGALGRRVRDPAAVRHPGRRARLRAHPRLQPAAAAAHAHGYRQHRPAGLRLRRALAAIHVSSGRHGSSSHRHPKPDRGRPEHGRRLVHDHRPDHPAQPPGGPPERRLPDARDRAR